MSVQLVFLHRSPIAVLLCDVCHVDCRLERECLLMMIRRHYVTVMPFSEPSLLTVLCGGAV